MLERQSADRVPELVPLRYGRMLVSAFTFYRGACRDHGRRPGRTPSSGLWVQACGDAHLSNFGAYAAPDRELVVDINDFDETLPGPWEWDLKRLAASFEIGGRDRGFDDVRAARRRAHRSAGLSRGHARLAAMSNLDLWYRRVDVAHIREAFEPIASKRERKTFERNIAKTQRKDRLRAFSKLTSRPLRCALATL